MVYKNEIKIKNNISLDKTILDNLYLIERLDFLYKDMLKTKKELEEINNQYLEIYEKIQEKVGKKDSNTPFNIILNEKENYIEINGESSGENWIEFLNSICKNNPELNIYYIFSWYSSNANKTKSQAYINDNGQVKLIESSFIRK